MEIKFDTKENFSIITPVSDELSANLAGAINETCTQLRDSGSDNFIIDLQHCIKLNKDAVNELVKMHEECYSMDQSLVFTGLNNTLMAGLKENETDLLINIAPRMEEAVDIISMEILERDLFNEE